MWNQLKALFAKESLCDEAYRESLEVLRECLGMYDDAVASLRKDEPLAADIYTRDRRINKFERAVRRNIVSHLAVSTRPDVALSLVLTSVVIDIERIGDYTKNIVELAFTHPGRFDGGELAEEIESVVATVRGMFVDLIPALEKTDLEKARRVIAVHQEISDRAEGHIESLAAGRLMAGNSGEAVTAALFLRYLKRIGAHLKNVATSIVNPYYRIGYREKQPPGEEAGSE